MIAVGTLKLRGRRTGLGACGEGRASGFRLRR
jgi:hypothetical protein